MTVLSRLSKACSAFLSQPNGSGAAALSTDISQERTNLTNNTTYVDEAMSARTAIDAPRSISIVVDLKSTDLRPLLHLGTDATHYSYRVNIGSGAIQVGEANSTLVSVAVPSLAVTPRKCLIHWGVRPDGANNKSELLIYNFDTSEWAFGSAVHAVNTPSATDTLTIGGSTGGGQLFSGGLTAFHVVRIGRRFVSGTEASEDFVDETSPPAFSGRRRTPLLTSPSSEFMFSGPGEFAGPQFFTALAATQAADARGKTALVNVVHTNPATEYNDYAPTNWVFAAPDDDYFHCNLRYAWIASQPRVNRARCRIHVETFHTISPTDPICPLHFRMYCFGSIYGGMGPAINFPFTKYRHTPDHTPLATQTGDPGVWIELGDLPLLKGALFALAYSFNEDEGDPLEDLTAFKIKAVTIEPYFEDTGDGVDDGAQIPGEAKN